MHVSSCMYGFLASFVMNGTCMRVFGSFAVMGMGFSWDDSGFNLALPFLDSHGVMEFILGLALDYRKSLDPVEVVSGKFQGLGVEMVFSGKPSISGWRQEISSRDGKGIFRHPRLI